jgi:hypothetical protein
MKTKQIILSIIVLFTFSVMIGCSGKKAAKLSEKGEMLIAKTWKPDVNANLKGGSDKVDSATKIKSDIQLKGDVKKMADFFAGTLRFAKDTKDASKLSYERKYGEGILSTSVLGYWEFNKDETAIIMREWDKAASKEKDPVTYQIVELSADKLVLKKEGESEEFYVAK